MVTWCALMAAYEIDQAQLCVAASDFLSVAEVGVSISPIAVRLLT